MTTEETKETTTETETAKKTRASKSFPFVLFKQAEDGNWEDVTPKGMTANTTEQCKEVIVGKGMTGTFIIAQEKYRGETKTTVVLE